MTTPQFLIMTLAVAVSGMGVALFLLWTEMTNWRCRFWIAEDDRRYWMDMYHEAVSEIEEITGTYHYDS